LPGEAGDVEIRIDTKTLKGKIVKEFNIKSNDPQNPEKVLKIYASIEPEFQVLPESIYLGNVKYNEVKKRDIFVELKMDKLKIINSVCSDKRIKLMLEQNNYGSGRKVKVALTFRGLLPLGYSGGEIVLETSSIYLAQVKIPFSVIVTKD